MRTIAELRKIAQKKNIKYYSTMNKTELHNALGIYPEQESKRYSPKTSSLLKACSVGNLKDAKYYVGLGADVHEQNNACIRAASIAGNVNIVKYLVANGVDVQSNFNYPIIASCRFGRLELVKYLIEKGADFTVLDNLPVQIASEKGHLEVVKYLVGLGADFTVADNFAVREASANGHLQVVKYLVEMGANFQARDNEAIYMAESGGHFNIVKYLVGKGAPVDMLKADTIDAIQNIKKGWDRLTHERDFPGKTNKLFGSLLLAIQKLEESGRLPLAHQAMLEEMLEGWTQADD